MRQTEEFWVWSSVAVGIDIQTPVNIYGDLESSSFGIHPGAHLADMFNNGELAVMCNIGNLVAPVRDQYMGNTTNQLVYAKIISHSDQQRRFQSEPTGRYSYGWGGRLAELLTSYNTNPLISPLISLAGLNPFQVTLEGD